MEKREFNPNNYLSKVVNEYDGSEKMVLKAAARVAWFRSVYPEGKIVKVISREGRDVNGNPAVRVECRVYAHKSDAPDQFLANGFATRSYNSANEITQHYLECCETAAKIRALTDAGFMLLDMEDGVPEAETLSRASNDGAFCDESAQQNSTPPPVPPAPAKSDDAKEPAPAPRKYERKVNESDYDARAEMAAAGLVPSTSTGQTALFPEAKELPENVLNENIVKPTAEEAPEPQKETQTQPPVEEQKPPQKKSRRKGRSLLNAQEEPSPAVPAVESTIPKKEDAPAVEAPPAEIAPAADDAHSAMAETAIDASESVVEEGVTAPETTPVTEAPTAVEQQSPVAEEPKATMGMDPKYALTVVIDKMSQHPDFHGKTFNEIIHMEHVDSCKKFLVWAISQNPDEFGPGADIEIAAARALLPMLN